MTNNNYYKQFSAITRQDGILRFKVPAKYDKHPIYCIVYFCAEALMDQSYLTPLMAKDHLRKLWKNDRDLLRHVMGALNIADAHAQHPTDVFFLDTMPVCPSRFRPVG